MEGFTLTHVVCGQPANLSFYEEDVWNYNGEEEVYEPINVLVLSCETCKVNVRVEPDKDV